MSMPKYAEYKESGVEWLGEIPKHWRPAKIRTFTRFCGGGTPSRDNLNYWNGDIPWVSPKDMKAERIAGTEECITEEGLTASTSSMIDAGSLLMVVRSGILKHTIPVAINDLPVAMNQDMKALRFATGSATSKFFLRWVQGLNDFLLLAWAKQGATVESVEQDYLAETVVPLPPPEEQASITAFLDGATAKIDALIAEQETLLALLTEKRQATISHAVTRGLDPHVPMKDSGIAWLGEVPAHWEVVPLKRLARLVTGLTPPPDDAQNYADEGFPWLRPEDIDESGRPCKASKLVSSQGFDCVRVIPPDSVVICCIGTIGKVGVIDQAASTNQQITSAVFCGDHRYFYFATVAARTQMDVAATGNVVRILNSERLGGIRYPVPPEQEQRAVAEFLDDQIRALDQLHSEIEVAIELLKERRSALIAAAVTGKIDVRHAAYNSHQRIPTCLSSA